MILINTTTPYPATNINLVISILRSVPFEDNQQIKQKNNTDIVNIDKIQYKSNLSNHTNQLFMRQDSRLMVQPIQICPVTAMRQPISRSKIYSLRTV